MSVSKSNDLIVHVNDRFNPKWHDAARHRMPDVYVANNRKLGAVDDLYKQLLVFLRIGFIHRFPDKHPGDSPEHAGFLQTLKRPLVFFGCWFFFTGFQQQDMAFPLPCIRKQLVFLTEYRHIRISVAMEEIIQGIDTAAEDLPREYRRTLQQLKSLVGTAGQPDANLFRCEFLSFGIPDIARRYLPNTTGSDKLVNLSRLKTRASIAALGGGMNSGGYT